MTYDDTGKIPIGLATPCAQRIIGLGGKLFNGWVLVTGDDMMPHAVKP